jgi:cyclopropane-fatty-acyl-phospholipid synthase
MTTTLIEPRAARRAAPSVPSGPPGPLERYARRKLLERLEGLSWGRIAIRDALGTAHLGASAGGPRVFLEVHNARFYLDVLTRGSVGAGEAWVRGAWTCDDLVGLVRILVRNRAALERLEGGLARLGAAALRWYHGRRDNSRAGARNNVRAHYDVGNDFYRLFLDREAMMYSCALHERHGATLEEAQRARLERIGRMLELGPADHVLEIGTGWGGFALHAARTYGCRVTTTTISRAQHEHALAAVRHAGLTERVEVLLTDYRDLRGSYDKLVSIEMIEAVGERWYDTYFATCNALLAPDGMMLLQTITIRDQAYPAALRSVDFIQRHVFPGSCIPCTSALLERVARVTDMTLFHLEDIGPHYARTLREWRRRLGERRAEALALGYSPEFLRLWEFYFAYCEGGFLERSIGDALMLFTKPLCRRAPLSTVS